MQIVCLASDSHDMFSLKKIIKMSSAAVVISVLKVRVDMLSANMIKRVLDIFEILCLNLKQSVV